MNGFVRRIVGFTAATALALAGLTGCGPAEPKNAQELVERFVALEDHDNFHSDSTIGVSFELFGQSMPMNIEMSMDVAGDSSHATTSTTLFGEDVVNEIYEVKEGDDYVQYSSVGTGDDATWSKSKADGTSLAQVLSDGEDKLLEDAQFAATDDGYTITVSGAKLMELLGDLDSLDSLDEVVGDSSESFKDSTATLTFGKDYHLTSLDYVATIDGSDEAEDQDDEGQGGFNLSVSIELSIKMTFDGYGTIDPESVVVPDAVKEKALDTDKFVSEIEDLVDEVVGTSDDDADEANDGADEASDEVDEASDEVDEAA